MQYFERIFFMFIGVIVGLAVGYVLAERYQTVPPARAMAASMGQEAMPPGHPPVGDQAASQADQEFLDQVRALQSMLVDDPRNFDVLVGLGNLYYDHSRWAEAETWYRKALEIRPDDANVLTDLAVALRNQGKAEDALSTLEHVLRQEPGHWQALYNKVVVLNFDLHRHDEALEALERLKAMKRENPQIPDLSALEREIKG